MKRPGRNGIGISLRSMKAKPLTTKSRSTPSVSNTIVMLMAALRLIPPATMTVAPIARKTAKGSRPPGGGEQMNKI